MALIFLVSVWNHKQTAVGGESGHNKTLAYLRSYFSRYDQIKGKKIEFWHEGNQTDCA